MAGLSEAHLDILRKLITSLLTLGLMLLANLALRRLVKMRGRDPSHLHTLYMLTRNAMLVAGSVIILLIWLGIGSNLSVAMGILGAGIAFASQEVIGSFAGYVNIVTSNLFRIGDRVRVGNVVGDVLDISVLRTTVMEIGEWVQADQYTGRIVTLANRVVFSDPLFNYTQHWPYLWDEIMIPVTYESNWRRAGEIMLEHGRTVTDLFQAQAETDLRALTERYPIHETGIEPALYVVMTDNWIEITLRYVVAVQERRRVMAELHQELVQHFESESGITVASATFEIVGFPPLKGESLPRPS